MAFSPDGRLLAAGLENGMIRLWDVASRQEAAKLEGHDGWVLGLTFSPDGSQLLSGDSRGGLFLWDVAAWKLRKRLDARCDIIIGAAWSPKGHRIAAATRNAISLFETASGDLTALLEGHTGPVLSVAFDSGGLLVASGSADKTVRVWDCKARRELRRFEGHAQGVSSVALGPDGKLLASGSWDQTVRLWDLEANLEVAKLAEHTERVLCLGFSPDGNWLGSGSSDGMVRMWRASSAAKLEGHASRVNSVAVSPDGAILASSSDDRTVRLWALSNGAQLAVLEGHKDSVKSVAFSPKGELVASGSHDRTLRLWDVSARIEVRRLEGHDGKVHSVAFSPDGERVASASEDKTVRLWSTRTGRELARLEGHLASVGSVAFDPKGRFLASGSYDGTIRLWDAKIGKQVWCLERPIDEPSFAHTVVFHPDGNLLASTDSWIRKIHLWDVASGHSEGGIYWWKRGQHYTFAFSPDASLVATGTSDRTVQVWDMAANRECAVFLGHTDSVRCVPLPLMEVELPASNKGFLIANVLNVRYINVMNVNKINEALLAGRRDLENRLPHLDDLKSSPFVFNIDFGLATLPAEPGIILIRGARQYGKSTWLEKQILETVRLFGPGSAFYLNGDEITDQVELVHAIRDLLPLFRREASVHRLFIDEITAIKDWQKGLKILLDAGELRKLLIVTTGSKASDLRSGGERLPGRKGKLDRTFYVFTPVSFKEFRRISEGKLGERTLPAYILSGGSPPACAQLAMQGRIPEYILETVRDWIYGEIAFSGRSRQSLLAVFANLIKYGTTPIGQAKLAREAGLANNTVAAGYIELLSDLLSVGSAMAWDESHKVCLARRPCKYPFINLLVAVAWHPDKLHSINQFENSSPAIKACFHEWIVAQEIWRRRAKKGEDTPDILAYWQSKQHEIDYVLNPEEFLEVKLGKVTPFEYTWFPRVFPKGRLTIINKERFQTDQIIGITLEDFLLNE